MAKFVLTAQLQLQAPKNVASVVNKIQQQLRGVTVNVEAKGAVKTQREIQKLTQNTDNAAASAKRMGSAFEVSFRRFTALALATRTITLFTNSLTNSVKEAVAFERELLKISQVTGKTMSDLRGLTDTITNLSTSFGVSSSSLLGVSRILSQAGFDAKQTEIALSTLAKTELAPTFDDITQTAEGAVAIFNQFRKGAEALEAQLGAINAVAGKFAVEAGDLISVLRRTGGVFQASGGDLNELIALFTSVRATTRESAESIATGLRTIFTRIQRPRTIEYLKQFGVELVDLEGKFIGPFEATRRLSQALAGLEQGDITFIKIAEELGGFRQIGKVIPLLQQFSVAQEALNVAQEGSGSLALDAAAAQQTLAVRIAKVQEEFTALIRSISETRSFQLMANTALALAEGLIKVGEAIRPIIPLLGALAAFKLTKGLAGFTGNVGRNLQGFNSGGLVPGTGNRDTVPAMLTPGEFVIKKDSVSKLGAANLASMNKYAAGGIVTSDRHAYGPRTSVASVLNANPAAATALRDQYGKDLDNMDLPQVSRLMANFDPKNPKKRLAVQEQARGKEPLKNAKGEPLTFGLASLYGPPSKTAPTRTELPKTKEIVLTQFGILDKELSDKHETKMRASVRNIAQNFAKDLGADINDSTPIKGKALNELIDKAGFANAVGAFFETALALTGAPYEGKSQINDSIDFAQGLGAVSSKFNLPSNIPTDATRTSGSRGKSRAKFAAQVERYMAKPEVGLLPAKFATGGAVGTDTVPALLTPGEFVVNKRSAQRIGYGSLNRMNKVGKYAKGGVVQRFADGTSGSGVSAMSSMGGNFINLGDVVASAQLEKELQDTAKSAKNATSALAKYGAGVFAVTTALNQMLPAVQENEGTALRFTRAITDSVTQVVGSIGTLGFALQGLGEKFQVSNLMQNKYVAGLTAATAAAALVSSGLEALYDNVNLYNKAVKEGNVAEAQRLATGASTTGARQVATVGAGALGGLAATFSGIALLANPIGALAAGAVAAGVAFGVLNANADTFQDFLSLFGAKTAEQVKIQTRLTISSQKLDAAIQQASMNAENAFKRGSAIGSTSLELESSKLINKSAQELENNLRAVIDTVKSSAIEMRDAELSTKALTGEMPEGLELVDPWTNQTKIVKTNAEVVEDLNDKLLDFVKTLSTQDASDPEKLKKRFEQQFEKSGIAINDALLEAVQAIVEYNEYRQKILKTQQPFFLESLRTAAALRPQSGFRDDALQSIGKNYTSNVPPPEAFIEEQTLLQVNKAFRQLLESGSLEGVSDAAIKMAKSLKDTDPAFIALRDSFRSINAETIKAKEKFSLINLGLSPFNANVTASNVALKNYLSAVDGSSTQLERSFNTLSAALSSTGSNISDSDFENSLKSVSKTLKEYGATQKTVTKTEGKLRAGRAAQQTVSNLIDNLKPEDFKKYRSAEGARNTIAEAIKADLKDINVSDEIKRQIVTNFKNSPLSQELKDAYNADDISGFQNILGEISSEFINQLAPSIKQVVENEKALNGALQKRIDAENKLYAAQTQALSIEMEAAQIQSQYGGKFVTSADKLANLTAKMNVGLVAGLPKVNASLDGFANRIKNIEATSAILSEQEAAGEGTVQSRDAQKRLAEITNETVAQARALIDIRKQEYDIIKRKSQLEKDSLDSLISGDVESFFKKQAAEGAVGAVALGRGDLATQFGGDALAEGISFLKGLRDAGIDEFQGQKISGPGGLEERTRIAALTARGVDSNLAVRGAQLGAETTPELNAAASDIRQAAQILSNAGRLQEQIAQNQVIEAQNVYINAKNELKQNIDKTKQEVEAKKQEAEARKQEAKVSAPITMSQRIGRLHSDAFYVDSGMRQDPDLPSQQRKQHTQTQMSKNELTLKQELKSLIGEKLNTGPEGNVKFTHHRDSSGMIRTIATLEKSLAEKIPKVLQQTFEGIQPFKFNTRDSHNTEQAVELQKGANVFKETVDKFVGFTPTLKLDTTNMVVTLNANQLLENMPQFILDNVKPLIHEAIENATVGPNGKLKPGTGSTLS